MERTGMSDPTPPRRTRAWRPTVVSDDVTDREMLDHVRAELQRMLDERPDDNFTPAYGYHELALLERKLMDRLGLTGEETTDG